MLTKFSSECVSNGHPDKICDAIADAILDCALSQDPQSFMAVEATIKDNFVLIYGEATTNATIDYAAVAKDTIRKIGYPQEFEVLVKVGQQSSQINAAVDQHEITAGDQGMMFGYACDETSQALPYGYLLACQLAQAIQTLRETKYTKELRPDAKTQVTMTYDDGELVEIDTILISASHDESVTQEQLKQIIIDEVINPIKSSPYYTDNTKLIINPSGAFSICGPFGDSGTTGRKIVVDTYGGYAPIGGGCFSSKDPSKVDRSGAYYSRYVAKNLVKHGLCKKALVQVAYGIGLAKPISLTIDTFGTETVSKEDIYQFVETHFDFSVSNLIKELDLRKPIYSQCVNYGAFTHEQMPWETVKTL